MRYRSQLMANIVWSVGAALLVNGMIFGVGWNTSTGDPRPAIAPPGFVIAIIWVVLFAGMGAARWLVLQSGRPGSYRLSHWIVGLIAFCLAYPFYTSGLESGSVALAGNIATIALAAWIALRIRTVSTKASALIFAVVAWCCYASAITIQTIRLNS